MRYLRPLCLFLSAGLTWSTHAASEAPEFMVREMPAPILDGTVNEAEWSGALRIEGLCRYKSADLVPQDVTVWLGTDGENLYVAMISDTPPGGKLLRRVKPVADGNANAALDDSIELFFDPQRATHEPARPIFQIIANALGAKWSVKHLANGGGESWNPAIRMANEIHGDQWHFEAALPLQSLGIGRKELEAGIGLRVVRDWKQSRAGGQSEIGRAEGNFTQPESMTVLKLNPHAPVIQILQLIGAKTENTDVSLKVSNPGSAPIPIKWDLQGRPESSAHFENTGEAELAPGASQTILLKPAGSHSPEEPVDVELHFSDAKTGAILLRREFRLIARKPPSTEIWSVQDSAERQVDLRVAHYPSFRKLRIKLDYGALDKKDQVLGVKASLEDAAGKIWFESSLPKPEEYKTEAIFDLPKLADGEYTLNVGLEGLPEVKLKERIVRHYFEWEGNPAGTSHLIVPPFTPIQIEDSTLSTLLRKHQANPAGLWNQVIADGEPLLASPMQLEARIGGRDYSIECSDWKWTETLPHQAAASGTFRQGALAGTIHVRWDYDGVMRWSLELEANPIEPVEHLWLRVFVRGEVVTLMNAITDGTRFNFAGSIPPGEGVVWDGRKAMRNQLIGSFVPYLWVGGESRGISIFGENDRGWINAPAIPCQELIREGKTLEIRSHLISGPAVWKEKRTIELGFLATPIKPMPDGWRMIFPGSVPADIQQDFGDRIRPIEFLGSTTFVGARIAATDPEPIGKRFDLWRKLGELRQTGKVDEAYFEQWKKTQYNDGAAGKVIAPASHIDVAIQRLQKRPREVLTYTNPRGARLGTPEGLTFGDEWQRGEFDPRNGGEFSWTHYAVDPDRSYADRMLWLYDKMRRTFNTHIYWDCVMLAPNSDPVGSAAYVTEDGRIQPGTGLWNLYDLIKRTATWETESGWVPFNMAHYSNTAIAPLLSYVSMGYVWEEKAGAAPFQERFSREYIRTEGIGRQSGVVPCALTLIKGSQKERDWAARTHAGVAITHEIHPTYAPTAYWKAMRHLLEFGYGLPEVRVFNYWDRNYPIRIEGGESSSLLLERKGEQLLVLCNYGNDSRFSISSSFPGSGKLEAVNLETGKMLPSEKDGKISVPLAKDDFAILLLRPAK